MIEIGEKYQVSFPTIGLCSLPRPDLELKGGKMSVHPWASTVANDLESRKAVGDLQGNPTILYTS